MTMGFTQLHIYTGEGSPCRVLNGGCEDICTIDERAQVICSCTPGRMLLADGRRCAVRVANCSSDQFECSTGFCIPYIYSCDGGAECPDSSDEDEKYCGMFSETYSELRILQAFCLHPVYTGQHIMQKRIPFIRVYLSHQC